MLCYDSLMYETSNFYICIYLFTCNVFIFLRRKIAVLGNVSCCKIRLLINLIFRRAHPTIKYCIMLIIIHLIMVEAIDMQSEWMCVVCVFHRITQYMCITFVLPFVRVTTSARNYASQSPQPLKSMARGSESASSIRPQKSIISCIRVPQKHSLKQRFQL